MSGQLYLLPCPISEAPALDALPASTVETARRIDHFLVEAARTARATLKAMGHPKPIAELDIVEIGHDPAPELISEWLQPVLDGRELLHAMGDLAQREPQVGGDGCGQQNVLDVVFA